MENPDQETIAWIVGGIITTIGAVVTAIKRTKGRLSTGAKVDDLSGRLEKEFGDLHETMRTYFADNARVVNENSRAITKLEGKVDESHRRLDEHRQRIVRLEDRIPPPAR